MTAQANSNQEKSEEASPRFLAMLPVEHLTSLSAAAVVAEVGRLFPTYRGEIVDACPAGDANSIKVSDRMNAPILLALEGELVTIVPVDKQLPPGTLGGAIARSLFWPEAGTELERHQAHVIVGASRIGSGQSTGLKAAAATTMIAAAITAMVPAIAVYWVTGEFVIPARRFREEAQNLVLGRLPVECWVHLGFVRASEEYETSATSCVTTGLYPFIGREIEFLPSALEPLQVMERLIGLIRYLVGKGPILRDGETVGLSPIEKIRVHLAKEGRRPGVPVIRLKLEQLDPTECQSPSKGN